MISPKNKFVHSSCAHEFAVLLGMTLVVIGCEGRRHNDMPNETILAIQRLGGTVESDHVGERTSLVSVDLSQTEVKDKDLAMLTSLPGLTVLHLINTDITDAGIKILCKDAKQLERLNLLGTKVTDKSVVELGRLTALRSLDLSNTRITDHGLKPLVSLINLRSLYLDGLPLTEKCIMYIKKMNKLEYVSLRGTKIGHAAIQELQKALPGLQIDE